MAMFHRGVLRHTERFEKLGVPKIPNVNCVVRPKGRTPGRPLNKVSKGGKQTSILGCIPGRAV